MPENVEIVRSVSQAFEGIDIAAIAWRSEPVNEIVKGVYTPDVELKTLESGLGSGVDGSYRGWDGVVEYLEDWLEPFREYHVEWLEYIDAGDFVLVPSRQWGIGRTSGARAELELTWVYELCDGLIARAWQYDTLDEAREAVEKLRSR